jgi:hypothetical protein
MLQVQGKPGQHSQTLSQIAIIVIIVIIIIIIIIVIQSKGERKMTGKKEQS